MKLLGGMVRLCGMCRTPHGVRGLKYTRPPHDSHDARSHPTRGAWIEIGLPVLPPWLRWCRTPHGVRGLKLRNPSWSPTAWKSHPTRGAWIEMLSSRLPREPPWCRTSCGVRGLKHRYLWADD